MISALPNAAKAITYVFFDGIDTVTGKQIGLKTGDVGEMKSFDDFYAAFIAQFTNILDNILYAARKYERFVNVTNPSVMFSATIESSLKKGVDAYGYGMKYPTSSMLLCSFATTVDSILAVKELVFETKRTSLAELRDALAANWEGYEDLRYAALHAKKKYGSGNPEADLMASSLCHWFSMHVGGQPNSRGSVYKVGVPSTRHFITQGKKTEATPDGRKMGEECSKNVAPVVGMERGGVTAMMRSALQLSPWTFSEAFVLDMMLHPSAVAGEDGLKAMKALIDTYMKNDGISIQFNIFSEQMLRDAQENPDKYQNLQVRVSGWNVLWNNMSREEQDAYIQRAASIGKDI
jgi:formate C-acetyltransferase